MLTIGAIHRTQLHLHRTMNGYTSLLAGAALLGISIAFFRLKLESRDRDGLIEEDGWIAISRYSNSVFDSQLFQFKLPKPPATWNIPSVAKFVGQLQGFLRQLITAVVGIVTIVGISALCLVTIWELPFWPDIQFGSPETGYQAFAMLAWLLIKVVGFLVIVGLLVALFFGLGLIAFMLIVNTLYHYLVFGSLINGGFLIHGVMSGDSALAPSLPLYLLFLTFVLSDIGDITVAALEFWIELKAQ